MKKLLFIVSLFLAPFLLSAQCESGSFALSFNRFNPGTGDLAQGQTPNVVGAGFSTIKYEEEEEGAKYFSLGLGANPHYFFVDNASLGLDLGVFFYNVEEYDFSMMSLSVGPELRYYFNLTPQMKFHLKANANYCRANEKYDGEWDEDPLSGFSFMGGGAFSFFPASFFSVDLGAGYRSTTWKSEGEFYSSVSRIMFDIGFTLFIK